MEYKFNFEALGTKFSIILPEENKKLKYLIINEVLRIENKYSRFKKNSFLSNLNKKLGIWQDLDEESLFIFEKVLEIEHLTENFFDITLKNILDNLGYDDKYSFKKKSKFNFFIKKENLKSIFSKKNLFLKNKKIYLKKEIDLGGIGKGFVLDKLKELLEKNETKYYLINAGGDIYGKNLKNPWKIYLEHPNIENKFLGYINLKEGSICSSSPKFRNWNGEHHLINSKTKKPENSVKSIFILSNTGTFADALATALFTSGFENAKKLSKKLEKILKISSLIISDKNNIYISENFDLKI